MYVTSLKKYDSDKVKELIMEGTENNQIVLPNFQRDFVWERDQQKELLTSFIYRLPIGSMLTIISNKNEFVCKKLCFRENNILKSSEMKEDITLLLDGQQRLATIKSMIFNFFLFDRWKINYKSLYPRLRNRWFLKIKLEGTNKKDIFGYETLEFDRKIFNEIDPQEITDNYIHYEIINERQIDKWFHPLYKENEHYDNGNFNHHKYNNIVSREAADKLLLPLWEICSYMKMTDQIHYKTLMEIARNRKNAILAELKNNSSISMVGLPNYDDDKDEFVNQLNARKHNWVKEVYDFIDELKSSDVPLINLNKNEIGKAIYAFENINKGGTPLSVFDLIVAKAAHEKSLGDFTKKVSEKLNEIINITNDISTKIPNWQATYMYLIKNTEISKSFKENFVNLLSILAHLKYGKEIDELNGDYIRKPKQLALKPKQIKNNYKGTIESLKRAYAFLQIRCGIRAIDDVPYKLIVIPIAYVLSDQLTWQDKKKLDMIEYWYWVSLFGGSYREDQNHRCINDTQLLYKWINCSSGNSFKYREKYLFNSSGYSDKDTLLLKGEEEVKSAVKEGLLQYVISKYPYDFNDNQAAQQKIIYAWDKSEELDKHHIYTLTLAKKYFGSQTEAIRNDKKHSYNSPLNLTYITRKSHINIKGISLDKYLNMMPDNVRQSHFIPDLDKIKSDDLDGFVKERLNLIIDNLRSHLRSLI